MPSRARRLHRLGFRRCPCCLHWFRVGVIWEHFLMHGDAAVETIRGD